jgi:hypothetical protein
MADKAADVSLVHTSCFGNFGVRRFAIERYGFGDVKVIDSLETEIVVELPSVNRGPNKHPELRSFYGKYDMHMQEVVK